MQEHLIQTALPSSVSSEFSNIKKKKAPKPHVSSGNSRAVFMGGEEEEEEEGMGWD